ncbi:MAG: peptide chain release factor N(5)-glutamine methyltransferase [Erysipelotrichaceae bacterium]|nr:peptide chain release factor N(5)-glutamine methyltransferase [Erysipelotrichaceae bacterium]
MTDLEYLKKYYQGDLEEAKKKLAAGLPVQYIIGNVDFYGITLKVNEDVLIPRFETEELVSKVIQYSSHFRNPSIVDIGTGSGAIAITLKKKLTSSVTATDISKKALNVAKENALGNNVSINFKEGNLLEPLTEKYDIVVSNPPYIAYDEEIMDVVKNNEPHLALYAPNNGIYYYEEILKNIKKYLNDKYLIAFEIGESQGKKIQELSKKYLDNEAIIEKDLSGRDRFAFIKNF